MDDSRLVIAFAALTGPLPKAGVAVLGVLLAVVLLAADRRVRALAMLVATGGFLLKRGASPGVGVADLIHFDWTGFVLVATFMTALVVESAFLRI